MRSMLLAGSAALLLAGSAFAQPSTAPETPRATTPSTTMPSNAPSTNDSRAVLAPSAPVARPSAAGSPPANDGPSNPAVKTTEGNNPGAPVAGANSFTEAQAKSRIEAKGYANVSGLAKDNQGIWRGKADKDGKSVDVSLDYQGNVVVR